MAAYGYAMVSSSDQSTYTQVEKLKAAGCQVVRKNHRVESGKGSAIPLFPG